MSFSLALEIANLDAAIPDRDQHPSATQHLGVIEPDKPFQEGEMLLLDAQPGHQSKPVVPQPNRGRLMTEERGDAEYTEYEASSYRRAMSSASTYTRRCSVS